MGKFKHIHRHIPIEDEEETYEVHKISSRRETK